MSPKSPPSHPAAVPPPEHAAARWFCLAESLALAGRRLRDRLIAQAAAVGLVDVELLLLWRCAVSAPSGAAQSELARRLGISPAQASVAVERLRAAGLLESSRDLADRRRQLWRLSGSGSEVLRAALAQIATHDRDLVEWLSTDDATTVLDQLARLQQALGGEGQLRAAPPAVPDDDQVRLLKHRGAA